MASPDLEIALAARDGFHVLQPHGLLLVGGLVCCDVAPEPLEPEAPTCAEGHHDDGGSCVPVECGVGTWGGLPLDEAAVHVDIGADEGGDGSEGAPLRNIQAGLDLAAQRGGTLVAVAAGSYLENLTLDGSHSGVLLAGRCRDLVILDASGGQEEAPGIEVEGLDVELRLQGLTVVGAPGDGLAQRAGTVELVDARIRDCQGRGASIARGALTVDGCEIAGNTSVGIIAGDMAPQLTVRNSVVSGTVPAEDSTLGVGLLLGDASEVRVSNSVLSDNWQGLLAVDDSTEVIFEDTTIRGSSCGLECTSAYGVLAYEGAGLVLDRCSLVENTGKALRADDPGTRVELNDSVVLDTPTDPDGSDGVGLYLAYGAWLTAEGCSITNGGAVGARAQNSGTLLELRSCEVLDTSANPEGSYGWGLLASYGGEVVVEDSAISGSARMGAISFDVGSVLRLHRCQVQDTGRYATDASGMGLMADEGGLLYAEDCDLVSNRSAGVYADDPSSHVILRDVVVRDTVPSPSGENGMGAFVTDGARLTASGSEWVRNSGSGVLVQIDGSHAALEDCAVRETLPDPDKQVFGARVQYGGSLYARGCRFEDGLAGVVAHEEGSEVSLVDCSISGVGPGTGLYSMCGIGVTAQWGGSVSASRLSVVDNEGPGLFAIGTTASISCTDCTLRNNAFAGAAQIVGSTLELRDSLIRGTRESVNLGGGVGVYSAEQWGTAGPTLLLSGTTIEEHASAGVWIHGEGLYQVSDNLIVGTTGVPHGGTTRCGDGVYASGTTSWDGSSGLFLLDNQLQGNVGAGLFLDEGSAAISGNTWGSNGTDLRVQGEICAEPQDAWLEVPETDICPQWHQPGCTMLFALDMGVEDVDPSPWLPCPEVEGLAVQAPLTIDDDLPRVRAESRAALERLGS